MNALTIRQIQKNLSKLEFKSYNMNLLLNTLDVEVKEKHYKQFLKALSLYCDYKVDNLGYIKIKALKPLKLDLRYEENITHKFKMGDMNRHSGIYIIYAEVKDKTVAYIGVSNEIKLREQAHSNNEDCGGYALLRHFKNANMDWLYLSPIYLTTRDLEPLETYLINLFDTQDIILLNDNQLGSTKFSSNDLGMVKNHELFSQLVETPHKPNDLTPLTQQQEGEYWLLYEDVVAGLEKGKYEVGKSYNRALFFNKLDLAKADKYKMSKQKLDSEIRGILEWFCDFTFIQHEEQECINDKGQKYTHARQEWIINSINS